MTRSPKRVEITNTTRPQIPEDDLDNTILLKMTSREERLQQRLRGAGTRQVGDVDFGLVFAPIAREGSPLPLLDAQSTPQPLPTTSSIRTPANSIHLSTTEVSAAKTAQKQHVHNANTSAKLRKLNSDLPPSSSRSTRSSQRTPRPDIYTLVDEVQQKSTHTTDLPNEVLMSESTFGENTMLDNIVPKNRTPVKAIEEVGESPSKAPESDQRLRTVEKIPLASSHLQPLQESRAGEEEEEEESTPVPPRKRIRKEPSPRALSPNLSQSILRDATGLNNADLDELSPEQPARSSNRSNRAVPEYSIESGVESSPEAETIDDEQAALLLQKNRRRRSSRVFLSAASQSTNLVSPATKKRKGRHQVYSSPAQQRQPKVSVVPKKSRLKAQPLSHGSPIPVTVHRLTKSRSTNVDVDDSDVDILNAKIPRPKRGDPNTIDVLSQVCQEVVMSALEALEEAASKSDDISVRRELKTKWSAVDVYGKELQIRLLEHTINLDNGDSLRQRLRDEQRRKLDLREQISRIRAEREQVAISMDRVRIMHESAAAKALSQDGLNNSLHDVELAIELGKGSHNAANSEMVGTELLLKRMSGHVSKQSGFGGLLRQLKEGNAFLERAALVLEGRKI